MVWNNMISMTRITPDTPHKFMEFYQSPISCIRKIHVGPSASFREEQPALPKTLAYTDTILSLRNYPSGCNQIHFQLISLV